MASAEALRPPSGSNAGPASSLRRREVETFARIPHNRALKLYPRRLTGSAWAVLIELDRMILAARGRKSRSFLEPTAACAVSRDVRTQALKRLEAAGVVEVEWRGHGLAPMVRHLWFPEQD